MQENLTKKQRRELKKQEKEERQQKEARKQKTKSLVTWIVVLIGLGLIVWAVIAAGNKGNETVSLTDVLDERRENANVKGNPDAAIKLIEYSDFTCSACAFYSNYVSDADKDYGEKLAIEYRHFPLQAGESNSVLSARAAEAAGKQNKFWEYHDILFSKQTEWYRLDKGELEDKLKSYAVELELNLEWFENDIDSDEVKNIVESQRLEALSLNLTGTPTIFLNGIKIKNPADYGEFAKLIEAEINWNP